MNSDTQAYYDDFSRRYDNGRSKGYHALIDELEVQCVLPYLEGARVLEAGCGTGLVLDRLAQHASTVCGFDLSKGMLSKAHSRGHAVSLGDLTHIPFASESFDVVCSFKVLAHVPDISAALSELVRVTRPGGKLVLEFYNPWSMRYVVKRVAGPQPISDGRNEADVYTRWDSPAQIQKILPANAKLLDFQGIRVITPSAWFHQIPVLGANLAIAERVLMKSPLRYLGGFLVAIIERT